MTNNEITIFTSNSFDSDNRQVLRTQIKYQNKDYKLNIHPVHETLYLDKLQPAEFIDFLKNQLSTVLDFIKQDVMKNKE